MTREEIQEEWDFIDAILDTKVMEIAKDFLVSKGEKHYFWFKITNQANVYGSSLFVG